ncbi:hypothetical protein E6P97_03865 [Patescibacteria group bacterium]|nr:MAG: hypothetical protein E6P97_03865 [Patescibacteria group bacterium]
MDKVILIGGAPGAGKSTLAKEIALARGVNWISTDQIRTIMQKAANKELNPDLFIDANTGKSAKESTELELKKAKAVWKGVAEFIEHNNPWEGCVIEGTAILPHLVARDLNDRPDVLSVFVVQSEKTIKQVIAERSKNPWINTKTLEQQEKKVEQTVLFGSFIKQEANRHGFMLYELSGFADRYDELIARCVKF